MTGTQENYEGWSVIELMGHRKLGGYVRVNPPEMPNVIRVDVFSDEEKAIATQYYSPTALYCLTPCTEEIARGLGKKNRPEPVARYELPAPAPAVSRAGQDHVDAMHSHYAPSLDDDEEDDPYDDREGDPHSGLIRDIDM